MWIHGDIQLKNVMFSNGEMILIDLDISALETRCSNSLLFSRLISRSTKWTRSIQRSSSASTRIPAQGSFTRRSGNTCGSPEVKISGRVAAKRGTARDPEKQGPERAPEKQFPQRTASGGGEEDPDRGIPAVPDDPAHRKEGRAKRKERALYQTRGRAAGGAGQRSG